MSQQIVPNHRKESPREERMLFVRTEGILHTMAKAPLLLAGLIIVSVVMPIQNSFSSTRNLDLIIYPDGSTHVFSEIEVDPLAPDFELELFGETIDNFIVTGDDGYLLSSEITGNSSTVQTFGTSNVTVNYDIHDLVSKEGRIWTFTIDAPSEYTLLMPTNAIIVGMSALPENMETIEEQSRLYLPEGPAQIDYIFSVPAPPTTIPPTPTPVPPGPDPLPETGFDNSYLLVAGAVGAAGVGAAVYLKKSRKEKPASESKSTVEILPKVKALHPDAIFGLRPDLREDDKELVKFIFENGGQAFESELRKKFLQPRTTMWRAVKRLERQGIVLIEKKDLQNLVVLKQELEEEQ